MCADCIRLYHNDNAKKSLAADLNMAEGLQYGNEIKERLGKHALDALWMLDTMFESAFPYLKKK